MVWCLTENWSCKPNLPRLRAHELEPNRSLGCVLSPYDRSYGGIQSQEGRKLESCHCLSGLVRSHPLCCRLGRRHVVGSGTCSWCLCQWASVLFIEGSRGSLQIHHPGQCKPSCPLIWFSHVWDWHLLENLHGHDHLCVPHRDHWEAVCLSTHCLLLQFLLVKTVEG